MKNSDAKKLYGFLNAKWYDPFKKFWNWILSHRSEKEFSSFLKKNIEKNKTILELGCGTALNVEKIFALDLKFKSYMGIDFTPEMLQIAKNKFHNSPNIEFRQQNITNLDNIKEEFDIILCIWVLSHLENHSAVINNAQKLLKPHGKMYLIFYTKPKWYLNLFMYLPAKFLFKSMYVPDAEIQKFNNVKKIGKYLADMVTTIEIYK